MIPQYLIDAKNLNEIKWIEVKSEKPEKLKSERSIIHFISTIDLDRTRDIMMPKGMIDKEFSLSPSVWYNHNYRYNDNALPVAKSLWRKKQEEGVLAKTQFATTAFAEDVYKLHEEEFMNTWSIGFRSVKDKTGVIEKDSIEHDESKNITTWHKWDLLEYSSAPIAANPNARDMVKDLMNMNWQTERMETELENVAIKIELQALKDEIEKLKSLDDSMEELKKKDFTQDINELKQLIDKQQEFLIKNISIELPVGKFSDDRIKTIVRNVVDGGR